MSATQPTGQPVPILRVVRGNATPEELAALLAVVALRSGGPAEPERAPASGWTNRAAMLRRAVPVGRGAWARSGWEHGVRTRADW